MSRIGAASCPVSPDLLALGTTRPPACIRPYTVTAEEIVGRIQQTWRDHAAVLEEAARIFYECHHTWELMHWCGHGVVKPPQDLWTYHNLLYQYRPQTVIETGSALGGSALWFAGLMDALQVTGGQVLSVDLENHKKPYHPRILWLEGSSTDPEIVDLIRKETQGRVLVSLDSCHDYAHVLKELELYGPLVGVGDYLVVEDTMMAGEDGKTPFDAVEQYASQHPGEWMRDLLCERFLFSFNAGGWLRRREACACGA